MPYETKRVSLAEVMPDAGEYAETVADDRAEYDSGHAHKIRQYDREKNVSAYLKPVADIVAQFVAVAVNHLFKIEDNYCQERVYRCKAVIQKRLIQYFAGDAVQSEIFALNKQDSQRGNQSDREAYYKPLAVDLVGSFFLHCAYLSCIDDAYACGYKVTEERYYSRYRCNGIYRSYPRLSYEITCDHTVAEKHKVHDRLGERAGYEHRAEFLLAKTFHFFASEVTVELKCITPFTVSDLSLAVKAFPKISTKRLTVL